MKEKCTRVCWVGVVRTRVGVSLDVFVHELAMELGSNCVINEVLTLHR